MSESPIPVLLVDDSPLAISMVRRALTATSEVQIVGTASHGREALELIPHVKPAVVCTDLHMPVMDGLELTRRVMAQCPLPILVISDAVRGKEGHQENVFELLEAGALDVFPKPRCATPEHNKLASAELIRKVRVLSGVKVFRKKRWPRTATGSEPPSLTTAPRAPARRTAPRIVVIGTSTGGPQALQTILSKLPRDFPVPILCVQHIGEGFLPGLLHWLAGHCRLRVKTAEEGELPEAGTVYFAPADAHLEVDPTGRLVTTRTSPVDGHRPSATVTMQSAAGFFRHAALGVLLSGMGRDGAVGLKAIADAGGQTLAQDEKSCVVFGMPRRAIELQAVQHVLPLTEIADNLIRLTATPA